MRAAGAQTLRGKELAGLCPGGCAAVFGFALSAAGEVREPSFCSASPEHSCVTLLVLGGETPAIAQGWVAQGWVPQRRVARGRGGRSAGGGEDLDLAELLTFW